MGKEKNAINMEVENMDYLMEMNKASLKFMENIDFEITEPDERLEGAIRASMGAGNPKGSRVKPNEKFKEAIEKSLENFLSEVMDENITQEKYDTFFYKTINTMYTNAKELDSECKVSFGRFQKIINIWIKYFVALAFSETNEKEFYKYKILISVAHIPVDDYVIKWLIYWLKENDKDNPAIKVLNEISSWKWGMTEDQYRFLQDTAKEIGKKCECSSPLELEMLKDIWSKR